MSPISSFRSCRGWIRRTATSRCRSTWWGHRPCRLDSQSLKTDSCGDDVCERRRPAQTSGRGLPELLERLQQTSFHFLRKGLFKVNRGRRNQFLAHGGQLGRCRLRDDSHSSMWLAWGPVEVFASASSINLATDPCCQSEAERQSYNACQRAVISRPFWFILVPSRPGRHRAIFGSNALLWLLDPLPIISVVA